MRDLQVIFKRPVIFDQEHRTIKKKTVKCMVKKRQLSLPEMYRKKYGDNILGFTVLT